MSDAAAATRAEPDGSIWLVAAWWALCAAVTAGGTWYALAKFVNHDVAYWLLAAERLMAGEQLYRDMIELNPPVNYLVSLGPVMLARALGIDPIATFHALIVMLAIAMTLASVHIAQRTLGDSALFARMLALPILIALLLLPAAEFGQREHLLAMVLLPYLVIVSSVDPLRLAWPASLAMGAGVGIVVAFKPFFALYLVVGEAIVLLRHRKPRLLLRIDVIAAVAVIAAAVAATVVAFPAYLEFIVPLGREIYHGYELPLLAAMSRPFVLFAAALSVAAVVLASRLGRRPARVLVHTLVAAAAAAIAVYAAQRKGWAYHALPAVIFAAVAFGAALVPVLEASCVRRRHAAVVVAMATIAVAGISVVALRISFAGIERHAATIRPLVELVAQANPRRALFLSTHLPPAFPVVNYAGASWPYRYHHLLPLPGLYSDYDSAATGSPFRRPDQMSTTEARFFATIVEDALRFPPQLIFVDRRPQFGRLDQLHFDVVAYFRQDPRFARLLDEFRLDAHVSGHDVYVRIE